MRCFIYIAIAAAAAVLFISCNGRENGEIHKILTQWDNLLEKNPEAISDSLKTIDPQTLSRENRAYYNLLKTISDDKTYFEFTSDSLINRVIDYYHLHEPYSNNYIRALTYKGIVRTRMGVTDSTVYEPLKKADHIFHTQKNPDPATGYILHYFMGNTHYYNGNFELAGKYFQESLHNAKLKNDSLHIFDAYLAIYWNEMRQTDFDAGKKYVDTLSSFFDKIPDRNHLILNAQSVYYEATKEFEKALDCDKKLLTLTKSQKEDIDFSSLYYAISTRYSTLNQLDSAMLYGQIALENIVDEVNKSNYLLYENVANIAEKQQNYFLANTYRQKAFDLYEKSVKDLLNTQVMELEKK